MAGKILTDIKDYIAQTTRNKIVICRYNIGGLEFINVGYELAKLLSKNSYNNEEAVCAILDKTFHNETIGNYLALTNISIIFEPELKINVSDILDTYSKNQCLIIHTDMDITQWTNKNGLSYKQA